MSPTGLRRTLSEKFATSLRRHRSHRASRELFSQVARMRRWSSRDVVIDVGANVGQTVLRLQKLLHAPRCVAFEPVQSTFDELRRSTAHLANVQCHRKALGAKAGSLTIHHHDTRSSMSSFRPWWQASRTEDVEVTTLDAVLAENGIDFVHLLKIDTEGFELEVLRGAGETLAARRIGILQVEVGLDPRTWPWTCLEDVRQLLSPHGYFLNGFFECNQMKVQPPADWRPEEREGYAPVVLQRCNALFVCGDYVPKTVLASPGDASVVKAENPAGKA